MQNRILSLGRMLLRSPPATGRPSSAGWTSSLTGDLFGALVSREHVSVLLEEISIAAVMRGYNVFIYYNNKHSCKMDYKK